jgi:hypothetical protein
MKKKVLNKTLKNDKNQSNIVNFKKINILYI